MKKLLKIKETHVSNDYPLFILNPVGGTWTHQISLLI